MMFRYDFLISDLLFRIESPKELHVPDDFQPFLVKDTLISNVDIVLEVVFEDKKIPSSTDIKKIAPNVFLQDNQIYRYSLWREDEYIIMRESVGRGKPCQLFIPNSFAETFCTKGKWLNYIAMERMLLPFDRVFLHASAVICEGKAYLFSAPSGGGKSTHAAIWENRFGAKILNGDKVIVEVTPNGCKAYGGPVAGSSKIYCNDSAPLEAIIFLGKAPENRIVPVSGRKAILSLYSEAIKSRWDTTFNGRVLELVEIIQKNTPVYYLECLPDESAVKCVLETIKEQCKNKSV